MTDLRETSDIRMRDSTGSLVERSPSSVQRTNGRSALPRKKACNNCTDAKTRCDLQRPSCVRCQTRGLDCHYTVPPMNTDASLGRLSSTPYSSHTISAERSSIGVHDIASSNSPSFFSDSNTLPSTLFDCTDDSPHQNTSPSSSTHDLPAQTSSTSELDHLPIPPSSISFLDVELVSSIDSSRVRNRWLDQIFTTTEQRPKYLSPLPVSFASQVFKTWPKMMLHPGGLPPIMHPMQTQGQEISVPLANCLSLVRMWENRARGSDTIATQTIKWEMERLLREFATYGQMDLLAAFQAYLIYSIMLFFSSSLVGKALIDRTVMINLQELACRVSLTGLVCAAELSHTRPRWESWIVAAAKRRTLYSMYILDNVYCALNNIPCQIADELGMLPAPASKVLWEARNRERWEREYDLYLAAWTGGSLRIGELWPSTERSSTDQQERIQRWLEGVDEYGMMYFSFSVMVHGI